LYFRGKRGKKGGAKNRPKIILQLEALGKTESRLATAKTDWEGEGNT